MKKHLAVLISMALIVSMLCGCGAIDSLTGGKRAKTAQEVVENYVKTSEEPNMHADVDMSIKYGISADGVTVDIPIGVKISSDMMGKKSHNTLNMKASMFGMSLDQTQDIYSTVEDNKMKMYTKSSEDNQWYVEDIEDVDDEMFGTNMTNLKSDAFSSSEMVYDKKEKTYTVTQTFSDFLKSGNVDLEDITGDLGSGLGVETDDFSDFWKDAKVVYTFSSEYNLIRMEVLDANYSGPYEVEGQTANLELVFTYSIECSMHGKITENDVKVPQDAVDNAVPSLSLNYDDMIDDSFGGYDEDEDFGIDDNTDDWDIDTSFDTEYDNTTDIEASGDMQMLPDVMGSYNGVNFQGFGDSWDATFGADGWEFDSSTNGEYSFVVADNSKYEDVELHVYNSTWSGATEEEIKENGIYGYNIDASFSESNTLPNMTWNGLTFGDTAEEIISVYGAYTYSYVGDTYTTYEYDITDRITLEFYVYPGQGIREVSLSVFVD